MAKVYFKAVDSYKNTQAVNEAAAALLKKIQTEEQLLDFNKPIPIKVHFGEDKCNTYITPQNFEGLINYLKQETKTPQNSKDSKKIFFTDTNVLYKGRRTTRDSHTALAKEHGFTQLPIIIADGEAGEEFIEVDIKETNSKHFDSCKIGKIISENEQLIVLAHFKGHMLAGFGGAIKQLSMGCASRPGKLAMHSKSKPIINPLKCKKCMTCTKNCPADACIISTIPHIDGKKCIGCAKCIAVCPFDAIDANWISTLQNEFLEKMAEYAYAAQKGKKVVYINFIFNVTKECDCMDKAQKIIAKDIGIMASTDPVALDKASLEILAKSEKRKLFGGEHVFEYSEKIGLGNRKYELINMN